MNKLYKEILANKATASEYAKELQGAEEKILFNASVRLLGTFTVAPGVSPNRILDYLAKKDDGMKMIKTLVRDHHVGIDDISNAFCEYFNHSNETEFWDFFNQKLNLPDGWQY